MCFTFLERLEIGDEKSIDEHERTQENIIIILNQPKSRLSKEDFPKKINNWKQF